MARIQRDGHIVKIFATAATGPLKGREVLVARKVIRDGAPDITGQKNLRFYDFGTGRTYTSSYAIGMEPARQRVFEESPETLLALFKEAGMPEPVTLPPPALGRTLRRGWHALSRRSWTLWASLNGQRLTQQ